MFSVCKFCCFFFFFSPHFHLWGHRMFSNVELCFSGRAVFTVELYLQTERALIVGAETQETQHDWIQALTKVAHLQRARAHTHTHTHKHTDHLHKFVYHLKLQRRNCVNVPQNYSTSIHCFFIHFTTDTVADNVLRVPHAACASFSKTSGLTISSRTRWQILVIIPYINMSPIAFFISLIPSNPVMDSGRYSCISPYVSPSVP